MFNFFPNIFYVIQREYKPTGVIELWKTNYFELASYVFAENLRITTILDIRLHYFFNSSTKHCTIKLSLQP